MSNPLRRDEVARSLQAVRERIARATASAGRDPAEITLIVVTKFFPADDVRLLHDLGVRDFGENRHQEASVKYPPLRAEGRELCLHFIGQLQSNKAAAVAGYADVVQTVDRARLVSALARGAEHRGRPLDCLVQIDLDLPDPSASGRGGIPLEEAAALATQVAEHDQLRLRGVMAVAPLGADPEAAFRTLGGAARRIRADHPEADWVSAGMSGDLEAAIAQGATHVRVGTAILGSRPTVR
ncbi:MAG TPA: YggS family pyridoxal phosphate-dependent enzyme [Dermatophilaceae bacterium]|jgi:pyridoxal phosphate enzyme (YggS family)|nr:YggS family pyridoxal phosphate-dependent enzyme [Actinomycetales bacterium]HMT32931.1 YggS family pyridoxal phosphate-dependent enzyme [Dermatophilaceae bacterium]HMT90012.1 YggS family pyridoxal phosphate-dependent enzyme [Dermatophilaceae bacterium]